MQPTHRATPNQRLSVCCCSGLGCSRMRRTLSGSKSFCTWSRRRRLGRWVDGAAGGAGGGWSRRKRHRGCCWRGCAHRRAQPAVLRLRASTHGTSGSAARWGLVAVAVGVVSDTVNHALCDAGKTRFTVVSAVGSHQAWDSAAQVASQKGWRAGAAMTAVARGGREVWCWVGWAGGGEKRKQKSRRCLGFFFFGSL